MAEAEKYVAVSLYWLLPIGLLLLRIAIGLGLSWVRGDWRDTRRFVAEQFAELPVSVTLIGFAIAAAPSLRELATGRAAYPLVLNAIIVSFVLGTALVALLVHVARRMTFPWPFLIAYPVAASALYLAIVGFPG